MNLIEVIEMNYSKIKKYAERKSSKSTLSNISWLLLDETLENEIIYIFKSDDSLIISENGHIRRFRYEFIVDSDNLIIKYDEKKEILYNSLLLSDRYLILEQSSKNEYQVFANRTKFTDIIKENILKIFKRESELGFTKPTQIEDALESLFGASKKPLVKKDEYSKQPDSFKGGKIQWQSKQNLPNTNHSDQASIASEMDEADIKKNLKIIKKEAAEKVFGSVQYLLLILFAFLAFLALIHVISN